MPSPARGKLLLIIVFTHSPAASCGRGGLLAKLAENHESPLSPIARVDENNGYGDDAALELALQASLEDAARAPQRKPAAPPGPRLHPFG